MSCGIIANLNLQCLFTVDGFCEDGSENAFTSFGIPVDYNCADFDFDGGDCLFPAFDNEPPIITVFGSSLAQDNLVQQCSVYIDPGATASDNVDDDAVITSKITTSGVPVDTTVPGVVTITYEVSDKAGNEAVPQTRHVTVLPINSDGCPPPQDVTPPVIQINGQAAGEFNQVCEWGSEIISYIF